MWIRYSLKSTTQDLRRNIYSTVPEYNDDSFDPNYLISTGTYSQYEDHSCPPSDVLLSL